MNPLPRIDVPIHTHIHTCTLHRRLRSAIRRDMTIDYTHSPFTMAFSVADGGSSVPHWVRCVPSSPVNLTTRRWVDLSTRIFQRELYRIGRRKQIHEHRTWMMDVQDAGQDTFSATRGTILVGRHMHILHTFRVHLPNNIQFIIAICTNYRIMVTQKWMRKSATRWGSGLTVDRMAHLIVRRMRGNAININ